MPCVGSGEGEETLIARAVFSTEEVLIYDEITEESLALVIEGATGPSSPFCLFT